MKTKSVFTILAIAAVSPFAWASAANASQQTISKRSTASPATHQKAAPSSHSAQNALAIDSGTKISAQLLTTLDAKKAKPGQRVVAKVTRPVKQNGRTIIRKNAHLIGHIVSARASGKGNASSQVAVAFDRLVQGKSSTALSAVVTSILSVPRPLSPQPMNMPGPVGPSGAPMGGGGRMGGGGGLLGGAGGAVGGVGSTVGGALNSGANAAGSTANAGMNAAGNIAGNAMAGAHGILVSNSITGSGGSNSSTAVSHPQPGSPSQPNSNPGLVNSVSGALAGNASASGSSSAAGRNFAASSNASNQTGATSVFSRRKGNVQVQSGTQMQLQVVGGAQQPQSHSAARSTNRPSHR
jgi:hypothetical protein